MGNSVGLSFISVLVTALLASVPAYSGTLSGTIQKLSRDTLERGPASAKGTAGKIEISEGLDAGPMKPKSGRALNRQLRDIRATMVSRSGTTTITGGSLGAGAQKVKGEAVGLDSIKGNGAVMGKPPR